MTSSTVSLQTIENAMEQMSGCKLPARASGCKLPAHASGCKLPAHASGCKLPNSSDGVRPHIALTLEDPFKVLAA